MKKESKGTKYKQRTISVWNEVAPFYHKRWAKNEVGPFGVTKKLLELSTKKQKEWVEEQDWYKDENFGQKLHDAPVIGLSIGALENCIIEKITYFQDYGTAGILKDKKYITVKRADELEALGDFTEEEKEFVALQRMHR